MYSINNISLVDASFKREASINFKKEIRNSVNIEIEMARDKTQVIVSVVVDVIGKQADINVFEIKTRTTGVFDHSGETEENLEYFSRINAPAIIFPYVRETISSLSMRASLQPVVIPPLNIEDEARKDLEKQKVKPKKLK